MTTCFQCGLAVSPTTAIMRQDERGLWHRREICLRCHNPDNLCTNCGAPEESVYKCSLCPEPGEPAKGRILDFWKRQGVQDI